MIGAWLAVISTACRTPRSQAGTCVGILPPALKSSPSRVTPRATSARIGRAVAPLMKRPQMKKRVHARIRERRRSMAHCRARRAVPGRGCPSRPALCGRLATLWAEKDDPHGEIVGEVLEVMLRACGHEQKIS